MKKVLQFTTDDGSDLFVEVNESYANDSLRSMSLETENRGLIENATENLEKAMKPLKTISNSIINCMKEITNNPDEIEVELGLKFSAKAGIILTSLDSEANLKIVLKWTKPKNEYGY